MKTNGSNAKFFTALVKRIQFLIVFLFPLFLSAQPDFNFQNPGPISVTDKQPGAATVITDNIISKQISVQSKYLQGNPIITMTKSNVDENQNPMPLKTENLIPLKPMNPIHNENQFNFSMKKPKIQRSQNPIVMKTRYPENHRNPIHL